MIDPHVTIEPSILYLRPPVVLISTQNEDGTANLAPLSSAWWLGWRAMLGLQTASQTPQNMIRTGQCVVKATHGKVDVMFANAGGAGKRSNAGIAPTICIYEI